MAPEFLHNKGKHIGFTKLLSDEHRSTVPSCFLLNYPLLLSLHLQNQIIYRKVRNLQIGVVKLVGKVSINLLCQAKSAA